MSKFIFAPNELVDPSDSPRLREAKKLFLDHRRQLLKYQIAGQLFIALGLGLLVAAFLLCGSLSHPFGK